MGTRSVTHIHEGKDIDKGQTIVCSFYRQFDGYPDGHGKDLAVWLSGKRLVNGIGSDFKDGVDFNRAGTMAVGLMAHIQSLSGAEVVPTGSAGYGEDYTYHIRYDGEFMIDVDGYGDTEYSGSVDGFIEQLSGGK